MTTRMIVARTRANELGQVGTELRGVILCECILLSRGFAVLVINATCIQMFTTCNFKVHVASWSYIHVEPIHGWEGSQICICYGRVGTC